MPSIKSILLSTSIIIAATVPTLAMAKPYEPNISAQRISDDIKVLSSDAYEGRGVGTRAETKTIEYIAKKFSEAGLQPGGANGSWYQPVELQRYLLSDRKATLNIGNEAIPLDIGNQITVSTRSATKDVDFKDVPLIFVGYGINAPERGWNDYKDAQGNPIDVKGKIIVVLINDADFFKPELNTFGGKTMTYYGRWTYKFEEAARRGALGCIIIHQTEPAAYGWATVKNSNTDDSLDIVRDANAPAGPAWESWVTYDTAQKMFKGAGLDLEKLKTEAETKDFHSVELKGVTLTGSFKTKVEKVTSNNVVAIKKGKTRPDEYVLYSAHWDHLGIGVPDAKGDKIYNGASDNASGVAALLELARAYGKAPATDRSVIFLSWTAEESGLLGSDYYVSHPLYPLAKTVAGINMDGINNVGPSKNFEVTGAGQSTLEDDLVKYAKEQNRYVTAESTPEKGHFFRSDHFPFVKQGVPMLAADSGTDLVKGGVAAGEKASEEYVTKHYHQPSDEWSADWDFTGAVQDLDVFFKIGYDLANSDKWPQWKPTSEFKAARDKTADLRK